MNYEFSSVTQPTIEIRVASGRADLYSSGSDTVTVDVSGSGSEFVTVEQLGSTILIREERRLIGGRTVNIRVGAPPGSQLEAILASMDISARISLGRVNISTASGDVDLDQVDSASIRTASGDVRVDDLLNSSEVSSASGDVRIFRASSDLSVSTASGDITIDRSDGRCEMKSASGDIRVGCCSGSLIDLKSMSGDVRVGIPGGTRVEAEIDSLSGDVRVPAKSNSSVPSSRSTKLRAKTVSGDVEVVRVEL